MDLSNLFSVAATGFMIGVVATVIIGILKIIFAIMSGEKVLYYVKAIAKTILVAAICLIAWWMVTNLRRIYDCEFIMASHPSGIHSITYGQVLDELCINMEWSFNYREYNDKNFVQLDADCRYGGKWRKITIQFAFDKEDIQIDEDMPFEVNIPFEIAFLGFDGEDETSLAEMREIVYGMFEYYADKHHIDLDRSVKNKILRTNRKGT